MSHQTRLTRVGITQGDVNGIGYEVILKMLSDNRLLELCTPIIYGSAKIATSYRKILELPEMKLNQIATGAEAQDGAINIINVVGEDVTVTPGEPSAESGKAAFAALEAAVADIKKGDIDVLLTAPINKNSIQSAEFHFPGHTEYLEAADGGEGKALMILCTDDIRVALVTTHLPLTKIAETVTTDTIVEKLRVFNSSLRRDFGVVRPRIAVLALNPHAGEDGLLGTEEKDVVIPAIEKATEEGIHCFGPYAADGFFGSGAYRKFDGILAMYHDQGLAPFKALAMDSGVNYTAGLSFVRTSPDHGTGYDIVGKGEASEESMRSALYRAIDIKRSRELHDTMTANPLRKQYFDKSKDNVVLDLTKDDD